MRTCLLLFFLLIINFKGIGQPDSLTRLKYLFGFNTSVNLSFYSEGAITPSVSYSNNTHYFSLGPRFWFIYTGYDKKFGADFSYRITPYSILKNLTLYFHFYFQYLFYMEDHDGTYWHFNGQTSVPYNAHFIEKDNCLTAMTGYGFKWRFWKQLYLNHHVGIGAVNYSNDYYEKITVYDNPSLNVEYSYRIKLFDGLEWNLLASLGIGYIFGD